MWFCWISPDHNSVSIQRSRSGYRAPKSSKRSTSGVRQSRNSVYTCINLVDLVSEVSRCPLGSPPTRDSNRNRPSVPFFPMPSCYHRPAFLLVSFP